MPRFRRKRRARPLWFPPIGVNFTIGEAIETVGFSTFSAAVFGSGAVNNVEFPLTFDFGQEAILADAAAGQIRTLADIMSSAWRLRRIFGNIYATFHPSDSGRGDTTLTTYPACMFSAGLMVRKVGNTGVPATDVDPLHRDDYDDPWIWRRTWILGQDARFRRYTGFNAAGVGFNGTFSTGPYQDLPATGDAGPIGTDPVAAFSRFPNTTAHYSGLHTGPYFDQKTNRLIGPEDRLILHFATKGLPIQPIPELQQPDSFVFGVYDLRHLGFLQRASNRRNASR